MSESAASPSAATVDDGWRGTMARMLVLARHTESEFNAENRFTGWANPPLSAGGAAQARALGELLAREGLKIDVGFSSALARARQCLEIVLRSLREKAPCTASEALNERDYGALTGLNKAEAAERWGAEQVRRWRRSYLEAPPGGESLRDTAARVLPFYLTDILPNVMRGQTTLVVAHGNSLRALVMVLEALDGEAVAGLEIATGEVRVYALDADTTVCSCQPIA